MTLEEIEKLCKKYFDKEEYVFPTYFEHRFDEVSSRMLYSLIRHYKPTTPLAIGTWRGGSTCLMMAAFLENHKQFFYTASELEDDLREETRENCIRKNIVAPVMIGDITKNLDRVPNQIDFLFHDTNHDLDTTKWIHENIFPRIKKGSLVCMHDWAVEELPDGTLLPKEGAWAETHYWIENYKNLGLKKLFWTYNVTGLQETGFFVRT